MGARSRKGRSLIKRKREIAASGRRGASSEAACKWTDGGGLVYWIGQPKRDGGGGGVERGGDEAVFLGIAWVVQRGWTRATTCLDVTGYGRRPKMGA